jgi:phosphoenolpyruvate synthase/pyruvate phosphate dikinase
MSYTKPFKEISKSDAAIAGGKGASLGEMTQAGMPVPPGFVVLAGAFERFIEKTDINVEIDSILHKVDHHRVDTVEHASEKIQALIKSAKMPKDIAAEVKANFKKLGAKYVAVRSSATAEDSSSAAWAGQLESYLNTTEKTLLENVQRCWASLFTSRAIFYRFEKKMHAQKISVAVVVQKMVESEVSGIAFSVHPVTEDPNQLIIEAGFGLGEAIVSGQVTPDSYVVEKEPRRIIDKNVSVQNRALYRGKSGGVNWSDLAEKEGAKQALSDKEIFQLSELILKIENHYGFPCDIEWAQERSKFYIVQSRPITTLKPKKAEPPVRESGEGAGQTKKLTEKSNTQKSKDDWYHWGRWVTNTLFHSLWFQYNTTEIVDQNIVFYLQQFKVLDGHYYFQISDLERIAQFINGQLDGDGSWFNDFFQLCEKHIKNVQRLSQSDNLKKFFQTIVEALACSLTIELIDYAFQVYIKKKAAEENVAPEMILGRIKPSRKTLLTEFNEKARSAHGKNLKKLLLNYEWVGTHGFAGEPLTQTSWRKFIQRREEAQEKLDNEICGFTNIIRIASDLAFYRSFIVENVDRASFMRWDSLKRLAQKNNMTWTDIIHLTLDEIIMFAEGTEVGVDVAKREKAFGIIATGKSATVITGKRLQKELDFHEEKVTQNITEISGQTAYRGRVQGTVRIVQEYAELDKLQDGEILVANETTPDFISAIRWASAIVTDQGGITSHAAIVARELKKPCIIGTKIATKVLHDGDLVEVDAKRGVVTILKHKDGNDASGNGKYDRPDKRSPAPKGASGAESDKGVVSILDKEKNQVSKAWHHWGRWPENVLSNSLWLEFDPTVNKMLGNIITKIRDLDGNYFLFESDIQKLPKFVKDKMCSDRAWFDDFFSAANSAASGLLALEHKNALTEAFRLAVKCVSYSKSMELLDYGLQYYAKNELGKDYMAIFRDAPLFRKTHLLRYEDDLRSLKEPKDIPVFIKKHAWIGTHGFSGEPLTRAKVLEALKMTHKAHKVSLQKRDPLISIVSKISYYRSYLVETVDKVTFSYWGLLEKIARKSGLRRENLLASTFKELISFIENNKLPADYRLRSPFGIINETGEMEVVTGERLKTLLKESFGDNTQDEHSGELKGSVAYPGIVQGIAKVIANSRELEKLYEGEILIATETTPDYILGMKRAAAFVTDQGGVTSHAAIVSRELKKPCIIGTKIATKVLHDGDLVEVDANKGIVHILKKENKTEDYESAADIQKSDYVLTFWTRGVSVLFTDICKDMYAEIDPLYVICDDLYQQFFWKKSFDRAGKEGIEFYGDKQAFKTFRKELRGICGAFTDFYSQLKKKRDISKEDLQKFLDFCVNTCRRYSKMDFEYTDSAFGLRNKNKIIAANLDEMGRFKDEVRSFMNTVFFESKNYLETVRAALSKKFGINTRDLETYTQAELLGLFEGKTVTPELLSARKKAFAVISHKGKERYFAGAAAKSIAERLREPVDQISSIRGQTANKGKVTGKVKIIPVNYRELGKLKGIIETMAKGDALVAETTAPELMLACKKASAIVTDVGGMMSHAAIVSRELKIPCIVGTKYATQVLKDGDLVEVDAERGIVTILERKDGNDTSGNGKYDQLDKRSPASKGASGARTERGVVRILKKK